MGTGQGSCRKGFTTDESGQAKFNFDLEQGAYRVIVETQDRFGKSQRPFTHSSTNPKAGKSLKIPHLIKAPTCTVEPGGEFMAVWEGIQKPAPLSR